MILATDFPRKLLPHSTNKQHTYTEYNFRNTSCLSRESLLTSQFIKRLCTYIWPDFEFLGRSMLSLNWSLSEGRMRRRARLCFQTAPLCSIPMLYAQYRPQGDQSLAASIVELSLTAKIRSINFQTAFLFPLFRVGRTSKGRLGSVVLSTAVKICSVFSSYSSLEV